MRISGGGGAFRRRCPPEPEASVWQKPDSTRLKVSGTEIFEFTCGELDQQRRLDVASGAGWAARFRVHAVDASVSLHACG